MKYLSEIIKAEETNFNVSCQRIGASSIIIEGSIELYDLLKRLIQANKPIKFSTPERANQHLLTVLLLMACKHQLILASLNSLRGYLTQSFLFIRNSIELCGFAYLIFNDSDAGIAWRNAGDDEDAYRTYRDRFKTKNVFPKNDIKLSDLYNTYDLCSKQIHSSIFSLARSGLTIRDNSKIRVGMNLFQLNDDISEPIRTLLWIVNIHLKIIRLFEIIFENEIMPDKNIWNTHINSYEATLMFHKNRWKDIITETI